jgi:polyhydroxyalkanoate synthase subunit PhaC
MNLLLDFTPHWTKAEAPKESSTQRLDRLVHTFQSKNFGGLSPVSLGLAWTDWIWHLALSPGRQLELTAAYGQMLQQSCDLPPAPSTESGVRDEDPRFRHEAWTRWPYCQIRAAFRQWEAFWHEAAETPGMTAHHRQVTHFFAKQWLDMLSPANGLWTNPVVVNDLIQSRGAHLLQGYVHALEDGCGLSSASGATPPSPLAVGTELACTPGVVVFRNHLIELLRYDAQTAQVHPEPVLIIPSWIMKYYILDLSTHNSMVRYLVQQGHTVYMLSWRNPEAQDHDLSMDDYLRMGVFDALAEVGSTSGSDKVHAVGYCLGGTLLAIAAAALARQEGVSRTLHLPALQTVTLLAAQTDFSEPGELGLLIDESQIEYLDNMTRGSGYLSGPQMAGSFQFLHSRDLFWTRRMRTYLLGEREQSNDLMVWNADTTRMPARMHHEYLTSLYLNNALASNAYEVEDHTVSLGDIKTPIFAVATQRDHISPWRSVYKLHHLNDAEITFVLTSGGHNAGIVSEPGHANRSYQIATRTTHGAWLEPDHWLENATAHTGSWWPAWQSWLAAHSSPLQDAKTLATVQNFGSAPGTYIYQRYKD